MAGDAYDYNVTIIEGSSVMVGSEETWKDEKLCRAGKMRFR